jgi:PAS domain S-box-containing protein
MEVNTIPTDLNSYGLSVADHISAMLAYWDKDLVCRFANAAYIEWFGRTREEMVGKMTLPELLGPNLYEKNRKYISGALKGIRQTFEREIKIPGGEIRHSIANYFPDIADGKVLGFFVHGADVTQMKLLEKELIRSNKINCQQNNSLLNFANIVSHNLNTYAYNLDAILDLFIKANTEQEKSELLNHLKTISKGFGLTVKHLNDIVYAQNQGTLKYEWVNLHDYVNNTVGILNSQLKEIHGIVNNRVDTEIKLWASAAYIDSIILNLLTNAIKYRHPDRDVVVDLSSAIEGKQLVLKIKDNGLGIDLNKHGKALFDIYKTFHGNADAKGVGLFITKFQAEAMGGRIEVESEVNEGTTFKVHFFLKSPEAAA